MLGRLRKYLEGGILPIMACYTIHPKIERFIKEHHPGIRVYRSFEVKIGFIRVE